MVGVPGILARIFGTYFLARFLIRFLTRFLSRFLARVLTRVWGTENTVYSTTGTENTVYSSTGTGENTIYYLLLEIQKIPNSILGTIKYYLKIARDSLFIE